MKRFTCLLVTTLLLALTVRVASAQSVDESVERHLAASSFLTFRVVSMAEAPQVGQFEQTTELIDYRLVEGVKVPFQITATSAAQNFVITVSSVEHNVKVDPSTFAKPAK